MLKTPLGYQGERERGEWMNEWRYSSRRGNKKTISNRTFFVRSFLTSLNEEAKRKCYPFPGIQRVEQGVHLETIIILSLLWIQLQVFLSSMKTQAIERQGNSFEWIQWWNASRKDITKWRKREKKQKQRKLNPEKKMQDDKEQENKNETGFKSESLSPEDEWTEEKETQMETVQTFRNRKRTSNRWDRNNSSRNSCNRQRHWSRGIEGRTKVLSKRTPYTLPTNLHASLNCIQLYFQMHSDICPWRHLSLPSLTTLCYLLLLSTNINMLRPRRGQDTT